jgi:predicted O-methyltransferase YrrM
MTDDLVKRLECYADLNDAVYHPWVYKECADRIEKLVEENGVLFAANVRLNSRADLDCDHYRDRIEKLEAALREIASISKIICKSEDMNNALLLTLKSHRDLAIKALGDAP